MIPWLPARTDSQSLLRARDRYKSFSQSSDAEGVITPAGAFYDPTKPGTVTSEIASLFKSFGWEWGGDWKQLKDWQHFEKS